MSNADYEEFVTEFDQNDKQTKYPQVILIGVMLTWACLYGVIRWVTSMIVP